MFGIKKEWDYNAGHNQVSTGTLCSVNENANIVCVAPSV